MITILNFNATKGQNFISVLLQYDLAEKNYTYTEFSSTNGDEETRNCKSNSIILMTANYQAILNHCITNKYNITIA